MTENGLMFQSTLTKLNYKLVFPLVLGMSLMACQSNKQNQHGTAHKSSMPAAQQDTLSYTKKVLKKISPYFSERDGAVDTTYIEISYPVFENPQMDTVIKSAILLEGESSIDQYADNFIEGYGNFIEENEVRYNLPWVKFTDVVVVFNSPQLMTLSNTTYEFSGGAHGNTFELIQVVDLENYRKLALNSFVAEDKMKEFTKIAEKFFRAEEGLTDTSSLEKDYFFEQGKFALSANYGILKEGLLLHYNQYEIKPYAAGTTSVIIPFDAFEALMTQTGKNYIKQLKAYYQ